MDGWWALHFRRQFKFNVILASSLSAAPRAIYRTGGQSNKNKIMSGTLGLFPDWRLVKQKYKQLLLPMSFPGLEVVQMKIKAGGRKLKQFLATGAVSRTGGRSNKIKIMSSTLRLFPD